MSAKFGSLEILTRGRNGSARRAGKSLAQEGLPHAGIRASGLLVPVVEVGLPAPDGPAEAGASAASRKARCER